MKMEYKVITFELNKPIGDGRDLEEQLTALALEDWKLYKISFLDSTAVMERTVKVPPVKPIYRDTGLVDGVFPWYKSTAGRMPA